MNLKHRHKTVVATLTRRANVVQRHLVIKSDLHRKGSILMNPSSTAGGINTYFIIKILKPCTKPQLL